MIHLIFWLNISLFIALIMCDKKFFDGDMENEIDFVKKPLNVYGFISCASIYLYTGYCAINLICGKL